MFVLRSLALRGLRCPRSCNALWKSPADSWDRNQNKTDEQIKKCLLWFCLDRLSRLKGHIELDWITQNFEASCGDAAKKFYIPQWSVVIAPGEAKKAAMKWLRQKRLEAHN